MLQAFKDYDGQPVNIREHQDAYEFFTRLQDSVDEHLRAQARSDGGDMLCGLEGVAGKAGLAPCVCFFACRGRHRVLPSDARHGCPSPVLSPAGVQGCPRAIHAAMGGTWAQLITVVDAPQYRSERVSLR